MEGNRLNPKPNSSIPQLEEQSKGYSLEITINETNTVLSRSINEVNTPVLKALKNELVSNFEILGL